MSVPAFILKAGDRLFNFMINKFDPNSGKTNNRSKGEMAEKQAEVYLLEKGFKILQRNYHFGKVAEIDIIAMKDDTLVFVEVKSRFGKTFVAPIDQMTPQKAKQLKKAAEGYIYSKGIKHVPVRFDVITIDYISGKPVTEHIEDAIFFF